ncbi:enhancer of polycomb-like protein 1 [Physcomitrium patens]|uniref:Enhancer of polycomb-like protein n=1 Tax=Physcomitrium patens TaxID=3218 RepID=A0A2K1J7Q5_PHYPA|nr:uncharacterized protein LOC112293218 [Physcomitrium patens]PNR37554.1 hypothetical protein PHYPA_020663 [Physcomitrium patens]|eukprot:XP_024398175.1 uncharacterized protein LOC112293218 [Physcomitrella patens]
MKRLSFRPRPLDINKKLSIVTSRQELDGDEFVRGANSSSSPAVKDAEAAEAVLTSPAKKAAVGSEIPTPRFMVVNSYEKDYTRTFVQPQSYIRARPARNENAQYCEYDLDDDDEHWLDNFNAECNVISDEKLETMLYKLEIADHHRRPQRDKDRPGSVGPVHGVPVPVVLSKEDANEVLEGLSNWHSVIGAVFEHWKRKRECLQKPILRRLQPAPAVNDPSPFNVFRPREKIHRPHTRRMQRRENDKQSYEKLRQVRHHLEQTREILRLIQEREKKKRELVQVEANIQRIALQLKVAPFVQHDAGRMEEDGSPLSNRIGGVEDAHRVLFRADYLIGRGRAIPNHHGTAIGEEREVRIPRRRPRFPPARSRWKGGVKALEHLEPTLLFTKPLSFGKLESAGIMFTDENSRPVPFPFPGRIGRGGRLVFDRWNPFNQLPAGIHNHHPMSKPVTTTMDKFRPVWPSRQV